MSVGRLLETFDREALSSAVREPDRSPTTFDDATVRSEGFEAGYASGWEDAQKSEVEARNRVAAELERNIETLAFTYHEAVDLVRGELFGFVDAVIETFLPSLIPAMTREHVRNSLRQMGEGALHAPIDLVVSADSSGIIADLLNDDFSIDLRLVEDDTLAPNQVFVRIAERETVIDLAPVADALKSQLEAMQTKKDEVKHVGA